MVRTVVLALIVVSSFSLACGDNVDEGSAFMTNGEDTTGTGSTAEGSGADVPGDSGSESGDSSSSSGSSSSDSSESESESSSSSSSGGNGDCGNGAIDMGEQCDGANLNGFTCEQLGYGGGTLGCDPVTCTYDTANCVPDMGGTSG